MKEMTVKEMYTLEETIAKDLFEGVTYPWEVLRNWVRLFRKKSMKNVEKMCGLPDPQRLHRLHLSAVRRSSERTQR